MTIRPDKAKAVPGTYLAVGCGCEMWTQDDAFIIRPCGPDCEVYRYYQQYRFER